MSRAVAGERLLVVTADDFGIGPATTAGILDLAARGVVTSAVLLVNSPFAGAAVAAWRAAGRPMELGWHPCLTLDGPVLPPCQVPSLVGEDGRFPSLGRFLRRLIAGHVREAEVEAEFRTQWRRFVELVGTPPPNVNAHHHAHVFRAVGDSLARVLAEQSPRPFVRRVLERPNTLARIPSGRVKRAALTWFGRLAARRHRTFPGADALIGVTDPPATTDAGFFTRWVGAASGRVVELCCHPGHFDQALVGRDGTLRNGLIARRPRELELLSAPEFLDAVRAARFRLVSAAKVARCGDEPTRQAA